jgi:hypothetical protein
VLVGIDTTDPDFATVLLEGGAKTGSVSVHAGAAVASHASHTHEYNEVLNHTHVVNVTDPGHVHVQSVNTATAGALSGYAPDTTTDTTSASGYSTASATTGITATTSNPAGAVSTGVTLGPSAVLDHAVTQPDDHDPVDVLQPYCVCYFWRRVG